MIIVMEIFYIDHIRRFAIAKYQVYINYVMSLDSLAGIFSQKVGSTIDGEYYNEYNNWFCGSKDDGTRLGNMLSDGSISDDGGGLGGMIGDILGG